jgi:hypothetical protein
MWDIFIRQLTSPCADKSLCFDGGDITDISHEITTKSVQHPGIIS